MLFVCDKRRRRSGLGENCGTRAEKLSISDPCCCNQEFSPLSQAWRRGFWSSFPGNQSLILIKLEYVQFEFLGVFLISPKRMGLDGATDLIRKILGFRIKIWFWCYGYVGFWLGKVGGWERYSCEEVVTEIKSGEERVSEWGETVVACAA